MYIFFVDFINIIILNENDIFIEFRFTFRRSEYVKLTNTKFPPFRPWYIYVTPLYKTSQALPLLVLST